MKLLYLLMLITPFHNDPRLGIALLRAGVLVITPIKILGLLTAAAAMLATVPRDAAPRLGNYFAALFAPFAIVPVAITVARGLPVPTGTIAQLLSSALLFIAFVPTVRTEDRLIKVVRSLVIGFAFGSLWIYKGHFIGHWERPSGLEGDGNYDALDYLLALPLAFWMAQYEESRRWRRGGLVCGLLLSGAVVLTESRAGISAGGLMCLLAVLRTRHKFIGVALLALGAIATIDFGPSGLTQRFRSIKLEGQWQNGAEQSSRIHFELLKAGLRMIEARPIIGVGVGQFVTVAPYYNPELLDISSYSWIAHDTFIQIGAEEGIPGLLLFLAMLILGFRNARAAQRSRSKRLAALGLGAGFSLIGISIAALSISAEFLPFCIVILLSQSLHEIAYAADLKSSLVRSGVTVPPQRPNKAA